MPRLELSMGGRRIGLWLGCIWALWASEALAHKKQPSHRWLPSVQAQLAFSFHHNSGVIGLTNGTTLTLSAQLEASLLYKSPIQEWRTTFFFLQGQTKTPTVVPFVKTSDRLSVRSVYSLNIPNARWFGGFAAVELNTSLLPGLLIRSSNTTLRIQELSGELSEPRQLPAQEGWLLTPAFAPFEFQQQLGVLFRPLDRSWMRIRLYLGAAAQEVETQQGMRVDRRQVVGITDVFTLKRLQDFVQLSAMARALIFGRLWKKRISYRLLARIHVPFYLVASQPLALPASIEYELSASVQVRLTPWLSFQYLLTLLEVPLVQPKLQVMNVISLGITWQRGATR